MDKYKSSELLNTTDANMSMRFGLKMDNGIGITAEHVEYWHVKAEAEC